MAKMISGILPISFSMEVRVPRSIYSRAMCTVPFYILYGILEFSDDFTL